MIRDGRMISYVLLMVMVGLGMVTSMYLVPGEWWMLGPFPIGEREDYIDMLYNYNDMGIFNITVGDNTTYPSELSANSGVVGWQLVQSSYGTGGNVTGIEFIDWSDTVDWDTLTTPQSWSVYMWYAYAVGEFIITGDGNSNGYSFNCQGIFNYYIQSTTTGQVWELLGDFYWYGTGTETIYGLKPDNYKLIIRLTSSVRRFLSPQSSFLCTIQQLQPVVDNTTMSIEVIEIDSLIPDVVGGILAGEYGSITVINSGMVGINPKEDIHLNLVNDGSINIQMVDRASMYDQQNTTILPGQKYTIIFQLNVSNSIICPLGLDIEIEVGNTTVVSPTIPLNCTEWGNPYLFTFLDFDYTVQYAMAYPPSSECGTSTPLQCNLIVATHGAGVEVKSTQGWFTAYPQQPDVWILFPSERRPWAYDWQSTSRVNLFKALYYLVDNLPGVPDTMKQLYSIDPSKILFSGHSQGSYGCYSMLTHYSDLAIGGACAAGFIKLEEYVYYNTRPSFETIDPVLRGLFMSSIAESDAGLYSSNVKGIPIMVRYGANDTVVSPWHSRRMARLLCQVNGNNMVNVNGTGTSDTGVIEISQIPNENHWFPSILNDQVMQSFYERVIASARSNPYYVPIPQGTITITTNNPSSSGTRANINIMQLTIPYRIGRIQLTIVNNTCWVMSTQNIRRFGFQITISELPIPQLIIVDGYSFHQSSTNVTSIHYLHTSSNPNNKYKKQWTVVDNNQDWIQKERSAYTYGPMRQILEKPFTIIYGTMNQNNNNSSSYMDTLKWGAGWLSNYFNTYGRGSPLIVSDQQFTPSTTCTEDTNYILLGNSFENIVSSKYEYLFPIQYQQDGSVLLDSKMWIDRQDGMGISFIAPNTCGMGLILVVSGTDVNGLNDALHSLPQRSGNVMPDYIITSSSWKASGVASTIATGYWTNHWGISTDSSYFTTF